ncbi:MAG: RagB/SusD family nutrient uptake outer membrane protein [Flavisolibacter sp.]
MKKIALYITPFLLLGITSCKKNYLETVPSNGVTQQQIFSRFNSVSAALEGIYKEQFAFGTAGNTRHDAFGPKAIDLDMDLMGNDMVVHSAGYGWFNSDYQYTEWGVATQNRQSDYAWYIFYDIIKQANSIINNIDGVKDATQAQKDDLKGQGLGLRAYAYYYLINLFQQTYKGNENKPGVPIYLTSAQEGKPRGTVQQVYTQIVQDLTQAETLLTGKTQTIKSHIDIHVVQGLRARIALMMEDWATAATYANKARTGYSLMSQGEYQAGFSSASNPEWMWGSIIPADQATIYASFFSHMDISTGGYAALGTQKKITKALYDQIPSGDIRKSVFKTPGTGTSGNPDYNQLKFHVPTPGSWAADYLYMRSAEMYLIEAEALQRSGNEAQARSVLETLIQSRNPGYSAASFTGSALLDEILLQRRIELWGEGFSLIDIKRLKTGLNRPAGPGNHGAPSLDPSVYTIPDGDGRFLMRIPQRELDANNAMTPADQNP